MWPFRRSSKPKKETAKREFPRLKIIGVDEYPQGEERRAEIERICKALDELPPGTRVGIGAGASQLRKYRHENENRDDFHPNIFDRIAWELDKRRLEVVHLTINDTDSKNLMDVEGIPAWIRRVDERFYLRYLPWIFGSRILNKKLPLSILPDLQARRLSTALGSMHQFDFSSTSGARKMLEWQERLLGSAHSESKLKLEQYLKRQLLRESQR